MSTILKALKKVEGKREATAAKTVIPRALKSPISKKSRSWLKRFFAITLFLMVAVGAATGYHFWQSGKEMRVAQTPADGVITPEKKINKIELNDNAGEQESLSIDSAMKRPSAVRQLTPKMPEWLKKRVSSNQTAEPTIQSTPVVVASPPEEPEVQQRSRPAEKKQLPQNLIEKSQKRGTPEPQMRSKASVQPKPSTQAISPIENSPKIDIPLLEDRSLVIQALVYSKDTTKRMIVLNGEILRQGHEYKGYIIETIESQRVLVKKNGKVSALPFGR